jgi:putative thioredoxin
MRRLYSPGGGRVRVADFAPDPQARQRTERPRSDKDNPMHPTFGDTQAAPPAGDAIKDGDMQSFARDVLDASMSVPVLVDFWAPWCGPCKQLTPALEQAVREAGGQVKLVKINVDENQPLAQQLRIASIPTVYAFHQGQPVDGFQGALPASQIKQFVDGLVQRAGGAPAGQADQSQAIAQAIEQAKQMQADGQREQAAAIYAQVLRHDPENLDALGEYLRLLIDLGQAEEAKMAFDQLDEATKVQPQLQPVKTALDLMGEGPGAGAIAELMDRVAQNPNDHQARYDLALALYAAGKKEEAAEALLDIVRRQRNWNDEAARKQLLKYFEAWGPADPLTVEMRRRLSSLLFA